MPLLFWKNSHQPEELKEDRKKARKDLEIYLQKELATLAKL